MRAVAEAVMKHAVANYDEGWDIVVECFDDEEIVEFLEDRGVTTEAKAIKEFAEFVACKNGQRDEIAGSENW